MSLTGVSIDSLCRPSSSPQAITAGCAGSGGTALTDSSTACESCSGGFFLFRGGCYKAGEAPGSEICTAASGGRCTACNTDGSYIFKNPVASPTLGSECILCWDTTGADKYTGVENCQTCTAPGSAGPATCSACQEGYFLSGQTCIQCNNACATCKTSASTCTSCPEGKYLKNSQCVETNQCTSDYYPDPVSRKCIPCGAAANEGGIEACATCEYDSTKGKPKCLTCTDGTKTPRTSLDGTSTCVAKTLDGCQGIDKELFMKQDQTCALCAATGSGNDEGTANCKTCTKTSGNKPACNTCKEGYYLDSSKACQACTGKNCATCNDSDPSKCASCKPGFFLKDASTGECIACDSTPDGGREGCSACSNTNAFKCTGCKPNYRRQQNGDASDDYTCTRACGDSKGHCPPPPSRRRQSSLHITTNCKPSRRRRSWTGCWGTRALRHAPDRAVLDGRGPLLAQMQAGGRLTPWRGLAGK
ncbi:Variant-specific surface protein [Giardia duodenalis]|uniref:Variant-specific surface protein n=1 Tax=Giardia intestinalis TaxID=5741 RepID=V6TWM6_GIAIN|nr:Variant-specific surface protein [Giardia intestinalis]